MEFKAFENKVWLSSPTMHGEEMEYVKPTGCLQLVRTSMK